MAAKTRILIVEDERLTAKHLTITLEKLGYEVTGVASTGGEAVEMAKQTGPDLVLMDVMLNGEMDGIEAAGRIQSWSRIPVVYLTAYSEASLVDRARLTEPFGYLLKPIREQELRVTLEMALYKYRVDRQASEELERQIRERTAELTAANEELRKEVAERKRAEKEKDELLAQLRQALAEVKTLTGFLPICTSCKKIRDDKGYWQRIESYIRDHSDADFTHSICPECAKRLYPEFLNEEQND